MIVLFTDFGLDGPYSGQMKAVPHQMGPGITVIRPLADVLAGNRRPPVRCRKKMCRAAVPAPRRR